jgi:hypothetical protein
MNQATGKGRLLEACAPAGQRLGHVQLDLDRACHLVEARPGGGVHGQRVGSASDQERILVDAVDAELEVQVGPGGHARHAHGAQELALLDALALGTAMLLKWA